MSTRRIRIQLEKAAPASPAKTTTTAPLPAISRIRDPCTPTYWAAVSRRTVRGPQITMRTIDRDHGHRCAAPERVSPTRAYGEMLWRVPRGYVTSLEVFSFPSILLHPVPLRCTKIALTPIQYQFGSVWLAGQYKQSSIDNQWKLVFPVIDLL